ncbi:hypothetical protein [Alteribacter natronophilus]|uniref:hypothetical protein n=1 Tax=Alteribacter natronophilus TaxID=2583810 RepID=UPI00110DA120|nr:hypothetical protein [Alteribacter natronophilus]TMW70363.1 hypothetical protein FGB90_16965 [Alteribacter natronophilus]
MSKPYMKIPFPDEEMQDRTVRRAASELPFKQQESRDFLSDLYRFAEQGRDIGPLFWGLNGLLFVCAYFLASSPWYDPFTVFMTAFPLPFIFGVVQAGTARRFGMEELEMSCRIHPGSLAVMRMTIAGLTNVTFTSVFLFLFWPVIDVPSLWASALMILSVFTLTGALALYVSRRFSRADRQLLIGFWVIFSAAVTGRPDWVEALQHAGIIFHAVCLVMGLYLFLMELKRYIQSLQTVEGETE